MGPAALSAQLSFLEDWYWATGEILEVAWVPKPTEEGGVPVLIVSSGPADGVETALLMFIHAINSAMNAGQSNPRPKVAFEKGDAVRVVDGPFANFTATVDSVRTDKQKVRVMLQILGRVNAVELDFTQVEKA